MRANDNICEPLNQNIVGFVDYCDDEIISGWLIDFSDVNRHLSLKVLVNGIEVGRCIADEYRQDLSDHPEFNGTNHAYNLNIVNEYENVFRYHEISVIEVETGYILNNSKSDVVFFNNQCIDKNKLVKRKMLTPILYGISSFIPDAPFLNVEELFEKVGGNTGNLMFCHAISMMTNTFTNIPWTGKLSSLSSTQYRLVLPLSNALGSHLDLADLAKEFNRITIPMIGVGLGAQGAITGIDVDEIPVGSWEWFRVISSKSATDYPNISLRGQMTFDAILSKGLAEKCIITGCPSNFINPSNHLGSEIFRRRSQNSIKRIAVVSGNPNLPLFNKLEQSLVKIVEDTNGLYVCQHPIEMLQLSNREYTNISASDLLLYKKYTHPELTDDEFFQWFHRWTYIFTSVPEWLSTMKRFDFVVGTRIHGVMAGIQAGIPSLCLCIDSRTLELCETMMIPHVSAFHYLHGISLEEIDFIFSQWDWNAFDDNRQILALRFTDFFNGNQLEVFGPCKSILEHKNR